METESPGSERTEFATAKDEIIALRVNQNELLGNRWQDRVFHKSIDEALGETAVSYSQRSNLPEEYVEKHPLVRLFLETVRGKKSDSRIEFSRSPEGKDLIFLESTVGDDKLVQVISPHSIHETDESITRGVEWKADKVILVGKSGVMDITSISDDNLTYEFSVTDRPIKKYRGESVTSHHNTRIHSPLPVSVDDLGVMFHELGHFLRTQYIKSLGDEHALVAFASNQEFRDGRPNILSNYETRSLKSTDERSAWAIGFSILREAHKTIEISSGSVESIRHLYQKAEQSLQSYDNAPYLPDSDQQTIPTFSKTERGAAITLREEMEGKTSIRDIPLHYKSQAIANRPSKILDLLSTDQNFSDEIERRKLIRLKRDDQIIQGKFERLLQSYGLTQGMIPKKDIVGNEHEGDISKIIKMMESESYTDLAKRRLAELMEERGITPNNLPKYDSETGEYISDNPRRQIIAIITNS